jgi:hypothetical protein
MIKDLNKRLYYFAMFDGCLQRKENGDANLIVNMLEINKDYLEKVISTLEEIPLGYTLTEPAIYTKDGFNRKQQLRLQTKVHPILTKIHERMYLDGHKVLDPHMLTLLDAEALAIAFMADGSRYVDKRWSNASPKYRLHTNNISYGDNWLFKKALKETFDLEFNIVKKGMKYELGLRQKDNILFEVTIEDFILPSFKYKIGR